MNPKNRWPPLAYRLLEEHYPVGGYRAVQEAFVAAGLPPSTFNSIKVHAHYRGVRAPARRYNRRILFTVDAIASAHLEILGEIRRRKHRRRVNVGALIAERVGCSTSVVYKRLNQSYVDAAARRAAMQEAA